MNTERVLNYFRFVCLRLLQIQTKLRQNKVLEVIERKRKPSTETPNFSAYVDLIPAHHFYLLILRNPKDPCPSSYPPLTLSLH